MVFDVRCAFGTPVTGFIAPVRGSPPVREGRRDGATRVVGFPDKERLGRERRGREVEDPRLGFGLDMAWQVASL